MRRQVLQLKLLNDSQTVGPDGSLRHLILRAEGGRLCLLALRSLVWLVTPLVQWAQKYGASAVKICTLAELYFQPQMSQKVWFFV